MSVRAIVGAETLGGNIRYFLVWRRRRRSSSPETMPLLTSDVYILYSDEDFVWVRHQALPNVEDKGRLRTCFRPRDFDPKVHIMDSIVKNLNGCRKVLMVVSNSFCKDTGCQFELSLVQKRLEGISATFWFGGGEDVAPHQKPCLF